MNIHGFITLTLLDYPEHLAASIFLGGCNLRCPFCQNGNLVLSPENEPSISEEEVLAFLKKRSGILEGFYIKNQSSWISCEIGYKRNKSGNASFSL